MDEHLSPRDVAEFIEGEEEGALEHLAGCGECTGFLADVVRATRSESGGPRLPS